MARAPRFLVVLTFQLFLLHAACAISKLEQARQLLAPNASTTENGELEGLEFWEEHASLLQDAWQEWEQRHRNDLPALDERLIDANLREAIHDSERLSELWTEVAPGVFRGQLLNPAAISKIRHYMDGAASSGIPMRRPNGMNRYGLVLDRKTHGSVAIDAVDIFCNEILIDKYVRPLGRNFFSRYLRDGDDIETYAFTIRYKPGQDISLKEHADASAVTLNVNLNLPDEEKYRGSSVYFVDEQGNKHSVEFEPGVALLHRGMTRHAALPLESGERTNMVLWLFGQHGYVRIAPYDDTILEMDNLHEKSLAEL